MFKIDKILKEIGIPGPKSKYWLQLDEKFREKYQEFSNMITNNIDGIFDKEISDFDYKLCEMVDNNYDVEGMIEAEKKNKFLSEDIKKEQIDNEKEEAEQSSTDEIINPENENKEKETIDKPEKKMDIVPEKKEETIEVKIEGIDQNNNPVKETVKIPEINPVNEKKSQKTEEKPESIPEKKQEIIKTEEMLPENEKAENIDEQTNKKNDMEKDEKQPEVKKTEEIKSDETPEEIIERSKNEVAGQQSQKVDTEQGSLSKGEGNEVKITETGVVEAETETVVEPEVKTDEYPELTIFLENNHIISAKQLVKCGVPREKWNEDSHEFKIGKHTFVKTVPGLLFNKWTVFKKTDAGL